ncbi:c-type cytochrome [Mariniblastus fucicola]|uniref:Cytochrome c n=1 Tax=Mariniblastus fucicola TaxID=980251 RepID=A0A5B9PAQ3_9BACT|nr:c-type cytochrome [Mariniblastus fucicola]QEG21576.1 Cytochrome c [Mariniblastus fucicola]
MKQALLSLILFATFFSPRVAMCDETSSLALLVQAIGKTDNDAMRQSLLTGMLKGLEGRRQVQTPDGWKELSQTLSQAETANVRELTMQLSQVFGDVEATELALLAIRDPSAEITLRKTALRSLLVQQNEEASDALESLLDDPDLNLDAIRGFAMIENATAPAVLLSRYEAMDSNQKAAVIETLATRKFYARHLLEAVESKRINRDQIPVHVVRALKEILGGDFEGVFGELKSLGEDREKLLAKYKAMLTPEVLAKASASRGRAVYQKTCANCHLLYDEGGDIGPELTGSNRANLDYILLNSIDPSYDVAEGYRTVTVATEDGRLVMGVVAEEDATKLVLKTVEDPRLVIAKEDIEARKISEKSMMPDGQLEQMEQKEVIDLIKYLQTTKQVEVAK